MNVRRRNLSRGWGAVTTAGAAGLAVACSTAPPPDDLTSDAVHACDQAVQSETGQPSSGMLVADGDGTVRAVELWMHSDDLNVEPPDYRCVVRTDPTAGATVESLERVRAPS